MSTVVDGKERPPTIADMIRMLTKIPNWADELVSLMTDDEREQMLRAIDARD